jgi:hypothetical protein
MYSYSHDASTNGVVLNYIIRNIAGDTGKFDTTRLYHLTIDQMHDCHRYATDLGLVVNAPFDEPTALYIRRPLPIDPRNLYEALIIESSQEFKITRMRRIPVC